MMTIRIRAIMVAVQLGLVAWIGVTPAAEPVPAGKVEFAIGSPTAAGKDNRARPLTRGAAVYEGDLINTGAGRVQLRFTDGGFMSLQPQTQFKVEEYRFQGHADGSEKGVFNLVKGGMRTITGLIGKKEAKNYRVHTKVATIGVRGTEYSLQMDLNLQGSVAAGQIDVCNAGGCSPFGRGDSFIVPHAAAKPVMTLRKTGLPGPQPGEKHQQEPTRDEAGKAPAQTASAPPPSGAAVEGSAPPAGSPPPTDPPLLTASPPPNGAPAPEGAPLSGGSPPDPLALTMVPPQPLAPTSGFVQGDATDATGISAALKLTGPHFLAYVLAPYLGTGTGPNLVGPTMGNVVLDANGIAQSIGSFNLTNATGGSNGFSAGGMGYDGVSPLEIHYALGYPTLPADIQALQISTPVLAYAAFKGTNPTGYFGNSPVIPDAAIGRFQGGTMNVNLTTSVTSVQLSLDFNGTALGVTGANLPMTIATNLINPATTFQGGCSAGANCQMKGFIVGPNAQGAMMVYEFLNAPILQGTTNTVVTARGMVTFQRPP